MATVSKTLCDEIIASDGHYYDDPRVMQVVKYQNSFGDESWAILYKKDVQLNRYAASDYVINPEVVWQAQ